MIVLRFLVLFFAVERANLLRQRALTRFEIEIIKHLLKYIINSDNGKDYIKPGGRTEGHSNKILSKSNGLKSI